MREIIFRGKHMANGQWCEGNLAVRKDGVAIITPDDTPCGVYGQVDPETVCQYTGMTDKNGIKIFEGDILQVDLNAGSHDRCVVGFGEFEPFSYEGMDWIGFNLRWAGDTKGFQKYANIGYWLRERKAYYIGNVHDNPELLGV